MKSQQPEWMLRLVAGGMTCWKIPGGTINCLSALSIRRGFLFCLLSFPIGRDFPSGLNGLCAESAAALMPWAGDAGLSWEFTPWCQWSVGHPG